MVVSGVISIMPRRVQKMLSQHRPPTYFLFSFKCCRALDEMQRTAEVSKSLYWCFLWSWTMFVLETSRSCCALVRQTEALPCKKFVDEYWSKLSHCKRSTLSRLIVVKQLHWSPHKNFLLDIYLYCFLIGFQIVSSCLVSVNGSILRWRSLVQPGCWLLWECSSNDSFLSWPQKCKNRKGMNA